MKIFIKFIHTGIWDAKINGSFIPKHVFRNDIVEKSWFVFSETKNKKAQ